MTTDSRVSIVEKSPFVARVSCLQIDRGGETLAAPDGTWDLVFIQNAGGIRAIRSGLTTRPVRLFHSEGEQILAISFKPSVNMATVDPVESLDRGYVLASDRKKFAVAGEVFEIPTFNNADVFVERLAKPAYYAPIAPCSRYSTENPSRSLKGLCSGSSSSRRA
jgi:hypothetical protein